MNIRVRVRPIEQWCWQSSSDGTPCSAERVGQVFTLDLDKHIETPCGVAYAIVEDPGFYYCEHNVEALD